MGASILVVDDDEQIRHVLRRKLEQCEYDVCEAANGREAIRALETAPFDLVLTDIVMPDTDGIETLRYVRKHLPHVKVVAISAPNNELYLESAAGLGAARTFQEPLKLAELAEAIDDLLNE